MMDWQPIETAPTDGRHVLLMIPASIIGPRMIVGHWSGWGGGTWDDSAGHHVHDYVSHWMPLPDPPA